MASLTNTAYYTRRAINWAIVAILCYFILRILWSFFIGFWLLVFPPKPPPPNHAFGKLPAISFPIQNSSPSADFKFSLETISGGLPIIASDSAAVYFMPKASPNLLAIPQTQEFARLLELNPNPIQESRTIYRFDDAQYPLRRLRYDIVSDNFVLRYGYEQDTSIFTEGTIRNPQIAQQEAINTLSNYNLYSDDFINGTKKVINLRLVGNTLVPVENLSTTDAMRVNFYRGSINKLAVVTPNPDEGQISITFSGSTNPKRRLIELVYTYWPIDYQTYGTYSLKKVDLAWQELQNGKGFIAKYPVDGSKQAVIRNVYLAYYDSFEPQTYLQPIYVFEGDQDFIAYIPAIVPEWTE